MTDLLQSAAAVGLFVAVIIIVVLTFVKFSQVTRAREAGLAASDERTLRVQGQAAYYAWVVCVEFTAFFALTLYVGSLFQGFPAISALNALTASLLVSLASFFLLQWYLERREALQ